MRSVKYPPVFKQFHTNTRAFALRHIRPKCHEQGLNVTPLDAARHWPGKDQLQSALVFAIHDK